MINLQQSSIISIQRTALNKIYHVVGNGIYSDRECLGQFVKEAIHLTKPVSIQELIEITAAIKKFYFLED